MPRMTDDKTDTASASASAYASATAPDDYDVADYAGANKTASLSCCPK